MSVLAWKRAGPAIRVSLMTDGPIDGATLEGLASSFGGGAEGWAFVRELIDTFLEEAPAQLATLRNAVARGDAEEARRVAHTLKSNGATFGASCVHGGLSRAGGSRQAR